MGDRSEVILVDQAGGREWRNVLDLMESRLFVSHSIGGWCDRPLRCVNFRASREGDNKVYYIWRKYLNMSDISLGLIRLFRQTDGGRRGADTNIGKLINDLIVWTMIPLLGVVVVVCDCLFAEFSHMNIMDSRYT